MPEFAGAAAFVPADAASVAELRVAAASCHGCDLYQNASQTVFGVGPEHARILMVGEQPGDVEDQRGEPFVGPAGAVLRRAIREAGLDPNEIYLTNAVKHFKFTTQVRGKRRIHQTPDRTEVVACQAWLVAELSLVRPRYVVALGATAAKALLGQDFRVTRSRGQVLTLPAPAGAAAGAPLVVATLHPSAVLRAEDRAVAFDGLVADLRVLVAHANA